MCLGGLWAESAQAAPGVAAAPNTFLPYLVIIPLIAWRFYRRSRRLMGRQRLTQYRPWLQVILYPVLTIFVCGAAFAHPMALVWLALGLGLGVALGLFGLSKTQFETTPEGLFYTPHAHIGIAVSVLFLGRVAYRFYEVYQAEQSGAGTPVNFAHSPLTLLVWGLLAGYFVTYAAGLLRWRATASRPA